jgi:hypothetical protein
MAKAATIIFADTESPEGLGRVVNALTTAKEFKEAGDAAIVIFDGAGTKWIVELSQDDHKYHGLFEGLRDVVGGACAYCANAYGVKDRVEQAGVQSIDDYEGHPSVRKLISDGYAVLTF